MICPRKTRCAACVEYDATSALKLQASSTTSIEPELTNLRALLNGSHDPLSRVSRETASRIFEAFFEEHLGPKEMPFLLGAVCRLWRDIAWATPKIWTSAHFIVNPHNEIGCYIKLFEEYVGRSRFLPIDIHINWREGHGLSRDDPHMPRLVDILKGCVSRWNSLELYLDLYTFPYLLKDLAPIPHSTLRHLRLFPIGNEEDSFDDSYDEDNEDGYQNPRPLDWTSVTRNLKTLELDAYCDVVILDDLKVDCSSLTRVVGRGTYDGISTVIRNSPCLTTAMVQLGMESSSAHKGVPFIHTSLRTLKLAPNTPKAVNNFLSVFRFPDLNSLIVDASDLPRASIRCEIFAAFLANSGANLCQLRLENIFWPFEELQGALIPLLKLEELTFDQPSKISVPQIIKAVLGLSASHQIDSPTPQKASSRFPKLKVFRILSDARNPGDFWDCLQLIEEHCNNHFVETSPPEFGPVDISHSIYLQLLEIKLSSKVRPPYMPQRSLEMVERLGKMGVELDISWEYRGEAVEDLVASSRQILASQ
ncbi:hypothetical protein CPB83DRAFT_864611 [Crepidotus variabilis]|uniref:F-box domain-containing protein n=1 Tax=Crepidotus variabilis TaxID=179855 RepID=A0A9P6E4B5_9AGAR|nr:hypothetical protein CPB83DRAFT_864611 [Crepidotus variabilis]